MIARATLLVALLLAGCAKEYVMIAKEDLCEKGWKHQTVSKEDKMTEPTARIADGNNRARPAWGCEYGKNKAKG